MHTCMNPSRKFKKWQTVITRLTVQLGRLMSDVVICSGVIFNNVYDAECPLLRPCVVKQHQLTLQHLFIFI